MLTITGKNVNTILPEALRYIMHEGRDRDSRNGPVKLVDGPATICYLEPKERVLIYPERDANPFFHFMEGLWMLAGRNDVDWISQFNSKFPQFSDDGVTFHGAYGHRWRNHFEMDQLQIIVEALKKNPDDRRCVLQMWDAVSDLGRQGKDFPCNLMIPFSINIHGALDMTVFNRSNDLIWGALGANAVHMTMLQEYMAAAIGVPVGRYWQIANNLHLYTNHLQSYPYLVGVKVEDPYAGEFEPYPMVSVDIETWDQDLMMFMEEGPGIGFRDNFFRKVASPIHQAWTAFKDKEDENRHMKAFSILNNCKASDWRNACQDWLTRRANK